MNGSREPLAERMINAARTLQDEDDPQATLDAAVRIAAFNVRGCDAAAISMVHRRDRVTTPAYTSEDALGADLLQYTLGEGPCLDAAWVERVVHSADLAADPRWPVWAPRVAREHGAHSVLCLQLFTHGDSLGALNLYSRTRGAFDARDRDDGMALAAHIAVAVAAAQKIQQLADALASRTIISQACGILMERYGLDGRRAFDVLARISSHDNVKLRDVARGLVESRRLPGEG